MGHLAIFFIITKWCIKDFEVLYYIVWLWWKGIWILRIKKILVKVIHILNDGIQFEVDLAKILRRILILSAKQKKNKDSPTQVGLLNPYLLRMSSLGIWTLLRSVPSLGIWNILLRLAASLGIWNIMLRLAASLGIWNWSTTTMIENEFYV